MILECSNSVCKIFNVTHEKQATTVAAQQECSNYKLLIKFYDLIPKRSLVIQLCVRRP